MTPEEQNLIEGLFQRLRQADTNPKDAQAEQLIRAKTAELPSATYLLVQAVLVQETLPRAPGSDRTEQYIRLVEDYAATKASKITDIEPAYPSRLN